MPATGPGWNQKDVFVGVPTENDASSVIAGLGVSFNPGNETKDIDAAVKALNDAGGVLGHKIVPVYHDNSTPAIEANPAEVAGQDCTYFSQDRRVVEVINGLSAISLPPCLAPLHVPDIEAGSVIEGTADYQKYGPYLWTTEFPNVDLLAQNMVTQLHDEGYFGKWNTRTSSPLAAGPVKVGILEPNSATGSELASRIASAVRATGIQVAKTFLYTDSLGAYGAQMAAAELQFASAGVTHVLNIPPVAGAMLFFLEVAQAQGYHPRLGITSYDLPNQDASDLPHQSLLGAMGVGFDPGDDAVPSQTPKPNAPAKACDHAERRAGVSNTTPLSIGTARQLCDALNLFVKAATAGGGFTAEDIAAGMAAAGPNFVPGATYGSQLSATNHSMPANLRDLFWQPSCTCFQYRGGLHPITR
jgi:ABC-type branched-subunit amino acid transport system substrate-binding protein